MKKGFYTRSTLTLVNPWIDRLGWNVIETSGVCKKVLTKSSLCHFHSLSIVLFCHEIIMGKNPEQTNKNNKNKIVRRRVKNNLAGNHHKARNSYYLLTS